MSIRGRLHKRYVTLREISGASLADGKKLSAKLASALIKAERKRERERENSSFDIEREKFSFFISIEREREFQL